jgi:adenylate cyclase
MAAVCAGGLKTVSYRYSSTAAVATYYAILLLAGVVAALLTSRVSVVLAIVLGFAVTATLLSLTHNKNLFRVWHQKRDESRKHDDQYLFRICGDGLYTPIRRLYRWMPSDPRCRLCLVPFGGVGRILRIKPSNKNPNFCTDCIESAPVGVHEMEAGLLFADIRGFTAWSEKHTPDAVAAELTRFYAAASRVLSRDDTFVEFVGDQVMALYLPSFPSLRERMPEVMVTAARRLIAELKDPKYEIALPIGVGLHMGMASVGNVGKGQIKDFTAVGDVVNTAARLQSCAMAGQIVLSRQIYEKAGASCLGAESTFLSVKGKSEPLEAYVIHEASIGS